MSVLEEISKPLFRGFGQGGGGLVFLADRNIISLSSCPFLSQEIVDKDGQSKVLSFTVPSLSKPSVYHEVRSTLKHTCTHTPNVLLQKA